MGIKTRESLRTIKTAGSKVKSGAKEVKEKAEELQDTSYENSSAYAVGRVEKGDQLIGEASIQIASKVGIWGVRQTTRNIRNRKRKPLRIKVEEPKQLNLPKSKMLNAPSKSAQKKAKKMAAKATRKSVKEIARVTKAVIKKVIVATKAAVKATVAAIKGIVSAIVAGGWIAVVVVLLLCVVGMVVGSVAGIFAKDELGDNGCSLAQTVKRYESEFYAEIEKNKKKYEYDICRQTGEICDPSFAVSIYAVKTAYQDEVLTFNEANAKELKEVYNTVNTVTYELKTEKQNDKTSKVLYVNIEIISKEKAIEYFNLTDEQVEMFEVLLSDESKLIWEDLLK